jgi:two-component system sensor histidine kinase BaeS
VDYERMSRVLGNLVSNAMRYTPAGGSICLGAEEQAGRILLSVSDTGSGIPAEHLPNIFERFYRADASRQQQTGGSGLGLAIVRSMVEAHGGAIGVESSLGRGTTFTISLPLYGPTS